MKQAGLGRQNAPGTSSARDGPERGEEQAAALCYGPRTLPTGPGRSRGKTPFETRPRAPGALTMATKKEKPLAERFAKAKGYEEFLDHLG